MDAEMAAKDAAIEAAKKSVLSDADLDARVAARADIIAKAKSVANGLDTAGLSDAAIRKSAVMKALGDAAVAGKSDAYIEARFDILADDASKNADPVKNAVPKAIGDLATVYNDRNSALENAWKGGK